MAREMRGDEKRRAMTTYSMAMRRMIRSVPSLSTSQ
jgi:hypothetical protein